MRRRAGSRSALRAGALAALLLAGTAAAQPLPRDVLPGLGAEDPRRPVDGAAAPWRSLGRVQTELGGRCTGTLVGPRQVATAARCLVAPRSRVLVQPGSVHFLLGYDRGRSAAHARVESFEVGAGYRPEGGGPPEADWAVLTLEAPLAPPGQALPILRQPPPARTPVMLGGYQQDRPEVLLADTGCRMLGLLSPPAVIRIAAAAGWPMLLHGCAGTRGVSGAPLLAALPGGGWAVAGIASRMAPRAAVGAAVPAAAFAEALR